MYMYRPMYYVHYVSLSQRKSCSGVAESSGQVWSESESSVLLLCYVEIIARRWAS